MRFQPAQDSFAHFVLLRIVFVRRLEPLSDSTKSSGQGLFRFRRDPQYSSVAFAIAIRVFEGSLRFPYTAQAHDGIRLRECSSIVTREFGAQSCEHFFAACKCWIAFIRHLPD